MLLSFVILGHIKTFAKHLTIFGQKEGEESTKTEERAVSTLFMDTRQVKRNAQMYIVYF